MNRKYLCFAIAMTLAVGIVACGKKEEEKAAAPAATSAPSAMTVDPATAATVTGSVKLDGTAPKAKTVSVAAEQTCAAKHPGGRVAVEEIVTGDAGALANVVIYVKEMSGKNFPAKTETVMMDQQGCQYIPHVVAVQTNQTIEVKNSDATTHNIHPTPANNREWNESQAQGAPALQKSFAREEIAVPVKCNVHPWMKSYIAVFSHPYFHVTGKGGTFELKNLPPGDYTVVAWHEKLGTQEQRVTVAAKESKAVTFSFAAPAGD